jgi:hypothetical protein
MYHIRKIFSQLLLLGMLVLAICLGLGIVNPSNASAAIRQLEEAPIPNLFSVICQ